MLVITCITNASEKVPPYSLVIVEIMTDIKGCFYKAKIPHNHSTTQTDFQIDSF